MTSSVTVVPARRLDRDALRKLLGEDPLLIEHLDSAAILVDDRFHLAASRWLHYKYQLRPVPATNRAHADRLAIYIRFLRNERGLNDPNQFLADLFAATEEDVRAYYRAMQWNRDTNVSSPTWAGRLSTLKQIHEYLHKRY